MGNISFPVIRIQYVTSLKSGMHINIMYCDFDLYFPNCLFFIFMDYSLLCIDINIILLKNVINYFPTKPYP